jgi:transcriptional regulator with GAF, ATPase, and Fis domain
MLDVVSRIFAAESCWVLVHEPETGELVALDARGPASMAYSGARIPAQAGIVGFVFDRRQPVFVPDVSQENRWFDADRVKRSGLRSVLVVPLALDDQPMGVVGFDSPLFSVESPPTEADISRLHAIGAVAAAAVRNARMLSAVQQERERLKELVHQRRQLREQIGRLRDHVRDAHGFTQVVGRSGALHEVLTQVELVAPADSTVLLIGETGTGKEVIARALHEQSRRVREPFVAVNCAALPESLVESELFGYEKGAFTGATGRKGGKFELADRGTLFLDEIGDLPAAAQAKLLRVLQEREVHRIGGTKPVPINVRLIAATNQDLESSMRSGQFRPDLYYRLSVFPIHLPPLRDRTEDIPDLVDYFIRRFAHEQHKPCPAIEPDVLQQLIDYDWPGNIRELQNVVERAVILARDTVLDASLFALPAKTIAPAAFTAQPVREKPTANVIRFADAERHAIQRALELAGWRISGARGAAEILGLKPTTLHAKMKKLGIQRPTAAAMAPAAQGF